MTAATLTMRIDSDLKKGASEVAEYYGLDLSSVTRAFYTQMVRDRAIPLNLGCSIEAPNAETLAAMREAERVMGSPKELQGFSSAKEMMVHVLDEGE